MEAALISADIELIQDLVQALLPPLSLPFHMNYTVVDTSQYSYKVAKSESNADNSVADEVVLDVLIYLVATVVVRLPITDLRESPEG